jgi:hypothetical protein
MLARSAEPKLMACSAERERQPGSARVSPMPEVLYILGPSYSGSTLLTFLLASHPEIATVGELKASAMGDIESYRCSCGALLKECNFWRQVQHGMQERSTPFSLADFGTHFTNGHGVFRRLISLGVRNPFLAAVGSLALETLPPCKARLMRIVEQNRLLIDLVMKIQRGRVFLDGSKDPERLNQFLNSSLWKVKVIHLIRDGRGFANSYMEHCKVGMRAAAEEWIRTDRVCQRVLSRLPSSDALTIRYEDLCLHSEEVLVSIFAFVGLDPAPKEKRSSSSDFHILGNSMRLDFGKTIKIDETWKNELRSQDLEIFESIAGAVNRAHGYA